jgi:DNA-repair protein XRCC3
MSPALQCKPAQSALFLAQDPLYTRRLSTGCPCLDSCLGGGIDTHGVTEIAGAAGAGKTQLALQCMLQVQLPPSRGGLGGGAVFLHADTPSYLVPMRRLEELAGAFAAKHADLGATRERLMSHVYVMQLNSAEALSNVLHDTHWLQTKQVRPISY